MRDAMCYNAVVLDRRAEVVFKATATHNSITPCAHIGPCYCQLPLSVQDAKPGNSVAQSALRSRHMKTNRVLSAAIQSVMFFTNRNNMRIRLFDEWEKLGLLEIAIPIKERRKTKKEIEREKFSMLSRADNNNRRASQNGNAGTFTQKEWLDILDRYGHKCLSCGTKSRIAVDHVIPLSRGGTNTADNLQPLCRTCNSTKGAKTIDYRWRTAK